MSKLSETTKKMVTPGSTACAVTFACISVVLAVLLLTIGFWKTLFILAFGAVGALIGGIGNKKEAVRNVVNRSFPAKDEPLADITEKIEKTEKNENTPDPQA